MPLSNVTGAASLSRPGVCTSTTRPASPYTGQLIFETDTNRLSVYNGSSWIYMVDADTPPGLELVKTQTIGTSVATVTVSNCFSSTYDNYRILVSGGSASATSDAFFYLGNENSNSYYSAIVYNGYPSTGVASVISANNSSSSGTCMAYSSNGYNLDMTLFNPNVASRTSWVFESSTMATTGNRWSGGGFLNTATQHTSITFITQSSHTLTGGTIRVYGYRNS